MGRMVEYYDYEKTLGEILFRNIEKVISIVAIAFIFTVFVIVKQGSMEIESLERNLRITEAINSIQNIFHTQEVITIKPKVVEVVETEKTEEVAFEETKEVQKEIEIKEEVTEIAKASITILTAEEINMAKAINYIPTQEEIEMAYKVAFAEAGIEGRMGQILVINVAINNMKTKGYLSLMQEFQAGRYSSIVDGVVYNEGKSVELENVPQSVKDAVNEAFRNDYTEEILKAEAEKLDITDSKYWEGGATYFCAPGCAGRENIKVRFQFGGHMFYRYWDK